MSRNSLEISAKPPHLGSFMQTLSHWNCVDSCPFMFYRMSLTLTSWLIRLNWHVKFKHNCIESGAITSSQFLFHLVCVGGEKVVTLSKCLSSLRWTEQQLGERWVLLTTFCTESIFIFNGEAQDQNLRCKYVASWLFFSLTLTPDVFQIKEYMGDANDPDIGFILKPWQKQLNG